MKALPRLSTRDAPREEEPEEETGRGLGGRKRLGVTASERGVGRELDTDGLGRLIVSPPQLDRL